MGRTAVAIVVALLAACGRVGFQPVTTDHVDAAVGPSGCPPAPVIDTTSSHVVTSCTESDLRAAVATGGVITFSCAGPITVSSEIAVTAAATVIVGPITLDGGGVARVLHAGPSVQTLALVDVTIRNGRTATSGAGIYVEAGALVAIDSLFDINAGPVADPFNGGGAIAALFGTRVDVFGSTFTSNTAANGGAILAAGDLVVVDSTFSGNGATGMGGSSGMGGLGGAIAAIGIANNTFCGDTFENNMAGETGGAYLRISTDGTGGDRWTSSRLVGNFAITGGGAMYVQDIAIDLQRVSIVRNTTMGTTAGLWYIGAVGPFTAETLQVSENTAQGGLGAGLLIGSVPGTIAFSTIQANHAACAACWSAAIDGGGQTLVASVIAYNVADATNVPASCRVGLANGGASFQWPSEQNTCAPNITVADPMLPPLEMIGADLVARPMPGSPAIGAVAGGCPALDLVGTPRPTPCTAGALEP